MDLIFHPNRGNPFYIEVGYFDTILEIKQKIQKKCAIPISQQTLVFNGNILNDDINIHYSEILDRSRIHLHVGGDTDHHVVKKSGGLSFIEPASSGPTSSLGRKLRIYVVSKCGTKKIPMEVNYMNSIGELRKRLQKMENILDLPKEGYFFIYKQNVMDDDRSFKWHHVGQGDSIEIFSGSVSGG